MALERSLEGRDQLRKLVKRQAREIQERHRTGLQLGEPYTCHGSCLLSLYGDMRGVSYQKESGINSIVMEPLTLLSRSRSEHYDKSARKQGDGLCPLGKTRLHCGQKIRYTHMSIAPEIGEARVVRRRGVPRCRRKGVCPLG